MAAERPRTRRSTRQLSVVLEAVRSSGVEHPSADRVFARTGLADYLDEQGVPFERYETLNDVAAALT